MERTDHGRATRMLCLALALLFSPLLALTQVTSAQAASTQAPAGAQSAAMAPRAQTAAPAPKPASALLQPALDSVRATLDGLHIDKWKKGSIRDEASANIDSIRKDLRTNMAALLLQADAAPGTISKVLPVARHLDALYNVLLRVTEASRISGPDDQAAQLQKALQTLGDARLALGERIQGSAEGLEKQLADARTTIQQQAAQKAAAPVPVALPCVPPPPKKTTRARKPAAKPVKPSATEAPKP